MLPRNAPAWLDRLSTWLTPFEACFDHVAQRGAFRRYLLGLLSDSRRKSWKLPQPWTPRTRPPLLGNHRTVSTSSHRQIRFLFRKGTFLF
ncbi:MAG: hypothetical protein ACRD2N_16735, partial [Vicinamibacterales bacterium]